MKKYLSIFTIILMCGYMSNAQEPILHRQCPAQEIYERQNADPEIAQRRQAIETYTRQFLKRPDRSEARTGILTIPVIVHVIYRTSQENISEAQIQSQIDVLNEDFRKMNSDVSGVPTEFAGLTSDIQIEFVLSQITRKSSTRVNWGIDDDMKKSSQGGVDPIDPAHTMNMWICNIGGGYLGYAQFPGGPAATDGVVFSPQYCGSRDKEPPGETFYLSAPFDKGRTATHEVGHYLNLRHIWGDGNCSFDDFVTDTPTAAAPNYGCPSYPSKSCNSNGGFTSDMFMNYMDYVDDACMFMFTAGQKARMDAIFEPGGPRDELGTTTGGCELPAPSGLASSGVGDNGFTLSWNAVSGAVSYEVSVGGSTSTVSGTTTTLTGLTSGTSYTCRVRANCSAGSGPYSSDLVVTTTGSNCKAGPVTLSLTLDNYPEETSWTLTRNGASVASGGGYSTDGQTIIQNFDFGDGNYVFTISDSYGDGICCSYGNGSYSLTDANNAVIATGGAFSSSEVTSFCVEGGGGSGSSAVLSQSFFESGWDGWSDGGSDCARYSGANSPEGSFSIQLRDNSGTASAMTSGTHNLTSYDQVTVEFYFYPTSLENGEDFWLRYFNGSSWSTIATYARGINIDNNVLYTATVTLDASTVNFPSNAQFRFQCDASANSDYVYIDAVTITGISGSGKLSGNHLAALTDVRKGADVAEVTLEVEDVLLFPNPVADQAVLRVNLDEDTHLRMVIYDLQGKMVIQKDWEMTGGSFEEELDLKTLHQGVYMVNFSDENGLNKIIKLLKR